MIILALNAGSSSLKFAVCDTSARQSLMSGIVEKMLTPSITGSIKVDGQKEPLTPTGEDHKAAIQCVLETLNEKLQAQGLQVEAIGHRVVHGASKFSGPAKIDASVIEAIEDLAPLAPLHNPANLSVIRASRELYPELLQVAVFDTAFHQTVPEKAFRYAVPNHWFTKHNVRKYGFHGTSHSYVSAEAIRRFGLCPSSSNILVAHLGNGASATAVHGGKSVDTTMGISPLDGLVMGTRSGTVDPSLHAYISKATGMTLNEVTDTLTKESGMLALTEHSSDMRDIRELCEKGDTKALLAMEIYSYRLTQQLLGLMAAFPSKLDALIFTGGIGENSADVRARILKNLAWLGFELNEELNAKGGDPLGKISHTDTPIAAVIQTEEELEIALQTESLSN